MRDKFKAEEEESQTQIGIWVEVGNGLVQSFWAYHGKPCVDAKQIRGADRPVVLTQALLNLWRDRSCR